MDDLKQKNEIGLRIKQTRENLNLTQSEFAKRAGLTQAAISQFEKGERLPSSMALQKIAKGLNVSIDFILGGVESGCDEEKDRLIQQLLSKLENSPAEAIVQLNRYYDHFIASDDKSTK